jgi:hypothetical protein
MLLETMTVDEALAETILDRQKICESSTLLRLQVEYNKYRKSKKVGNNTLLAKSFEIKTKRKNNWIIIMNKELGASKDIEYSMFVHYLTSAGLRVISIDRNGSALFFSGHMFKRWNERLGLRCTKTTDMIKAFFTIYDDIYYQEFNSDTKEIFGVVEGGFLLGYKHSKKVSIIKTFINEELAGGDQIKMAEQLKKAAAVAETLGHMIKDL